LAIEPGVDVPLPEAEVATHLDAAKLSSVPVDERGANLQEIANLFDPE
jgi:hypothetical protein